MVHRCVLENEIHNTLTFCHAYACDGYFGGRRIPTKVLQSGFFWPTLFSDSHQFCLACERFQRMGALSRRDMMSLSPILIVEIFDMWGIDFMGPFPLSFGFIYILVDYVSKRVEAQANRMN